MAALLDLAEAQSIVRSSKPYPSSELRIARISSALALRYLLQVTVRFTVVATHARSKWVRKSAQALFLVSDTRGFHLLPFPLSSLSLLLVTSS